MACPKYAGRDVMPSIFLKFFLYSPLFSPHIYEYVLTMFASESCYDKFLQPIPNQKIHWRSLEGLANR